MAVSEYLPIAVVAALAMVALVFAKIFANTRGMSLTEFFNTLTGNTYAEGTTAIQNVTTEEEDQPKIIFKKYAFSQVIVGALKAGQNPKTGREIVHLRLKDNSITPWSIEIAPYMLRSTNFWDALSGKKPREFEIVDDDRVADIETELKHKQLQVSSLKHNIAGMMETDSKRLFKTVEHQNAIRKTMWSSSQYGQQGYGSNYYGYRPWKSRFTPPAEYGGGNDSEEQG